MAETWQYNTQKYTETVQPSNIKQVLICGLQANWDKHFNQGVWLWDCQLMLQEDIAPKCNYKQQYYCNSYNKKRFIKITDCNCLHGPCIKEVCNVQLWINRGYYMAARRYKISLRVLNNISLVRCAHSWNIFQHEKRNFVSPRGHVMFYLLYKHQWNTKPFHFNSFLVWKARLIM